MLERTKKHHPDTITLRVRGPADRREEAVRLLKTIGYVDLTQDIPWRDAFPEISEEDSPASRFAKMKAVSEIRMPHKISPCSDILPLTS